MTERRPIDRDRHAEVVTWLMRNQPSTWMALYRPNRYVYDDRDQGMAIDLENQCSELRIAFERVTDWRTAMTLLRRLIRLDARRRRMSIGVDLGDRILYGEAV